MLKSTTSNELFEFGDDVFEVNAIPRGSKNLAIVGLPSIRPVYAAEKGPGGAPISVVTTPMGETTRMAAFLGKRGRGGEGGGRE